MSKIKGQKLICDRCGAETFLEYLSTSELDGDYIEEDVYQMAPSGWGRIQEIGDLCPDCMSEWNEFIDKFKESIGGQNESKSN